MNSQLIRLDSSLELTTHIYDFFVVRYPDCHTIFMEFLKLTVHDLLLLNTASLHGIKCQPQNRYRKRNFFVAGDSGANDNAASLDLGIDDAASIAL